MKTICASALALMLVFANGSWSQVQKQPVDYVNPNIGGISYLLTTTAPAVQLPYSMMRIAPITTPGAIDRYLADKIYGFPAGPLILMPVGASDVTEPANYASLYDHDFERATPYYYSVTLEKHDIRLEYTVTGHAAYYRIAFPKGVPARLLLSVSRDGEINAPNSKSLTGRGAGLYRAGGDGYFYADFSKPVTSSTPVPGLRVARDSQPFFASSGSIYEFSLREGEPVEIRVGMSYISADQARENLMREIPAWGFESVRGRARGIWNQALSKIRVQGGTEEERTIFYTGLYRAMGRPVDSAEYGRYFSPGDKQVHPISNHGFYASSGGLWGSYRSLHPLQLLLDPERQLDFVRTFLTLFDQTGRLMGTGRTGMIGHHVAALVLDTYMKGYRDFDLKKAYTGLKKNALEVTMLPWRDGPLNSLDRVYLEKGFFPALGKGEKESVPEVDSFERRQAVSVTLESAYDDWCTAQVAKLLDKQDDYAYFMKRAHNYENVFDKQVGFMAPKTAGGNWKYEPAEFDPIWAGGVGGRDYYTEMNAWIYTFQVQHDIAGLAALMGGREKLEAKLDALFSANPGGRSWKHKFLAQFPDQTGLIGQYAQGNEPSFHIPYLYNYVGAPWKTQKMLRQIMRVWYNAGPRGISGDEDSGEESSWYVLSAMGFYPVCPGRPVYDIGSPIFSETSITLSNGKVFRISARNFSPLNKYVQAAQLNGKPLRKPWFEHRELSSGGTLVLDMGPRPNKSWGSAPDAAPPSMSSGN